MGMALPSFLILGAAKSGTTSLAAYLGQHPDVFVPAKKEPNYFALQGRTVPPRGPVPSEVLAHVLYNLSATTREEYERLGESELRARSALARLEVGFRRRLLEAKEALGA